MLFERFGIIAKRKHFFRWVKDRCHTECEEQMKDTVHIRNGIADHCHKYSEEPKPLPLMQQSQCANIIFLDIRIRVMRLERATAMFGSVIQQHQLMKMRRNVTMLT